MYGGADDNVGPNVVDKSGDVVVRLTSLFLATVIICILITSILPFLWLCIFIVKGRILLEPLGLIEFGCRSL